MRPTAPRFLAGSDVKHEYASLHHSKPIGELSAGGVIQYIGLWGHFMHREEPGRVVGLISDFVLALPQISLKSSQ